MSFLFKIGEKVKYINQNDWGIITAFEGNTKAIVCNSMDMEEPVDLKELIPFSETDHPDAYGEKLQIKDRIYKTEIKKRAFTPFCKDEVKSNIFKADLHIENLMEDYRHLSNSEIIKVQLERSNACVREAKAKQIPILHLIHGIGEKTLENAVQELLRNKGLKFTSHPGFTEVEIY